MAFGDPFNPMLAIANMPNPQSPDQQGTLAPMAAAVQPKRKINWLGVLADALSGAAGQTPLYTQSVLRQRQLEQQQALEEQQYQRHRNDGFEDYQKRRQFEIDHPLPQQPDQTERLMQRYLDPNTPPDEKALIGQQLIKPQAVTVTNADGSQELRFIYPGQMGGQAPRPVGKLTPIGGATPSASDTFPR